MGSGGMTFIPEYNGSRKKGAYKEWKRTIEAYHHGFEVTEKQLAPRVWLKLCGEAKDVVDSIDISELSAEHGLKKLWKILDKEFMQTEIDCIEEVVEGFWTFRRTYGMDM